MKKNSFRKHSSVRLSLMHHAYTMHALYAGITQAQCRQGSTQAPHMHHTGVIQELHKQHTCTTQAPHRHHTCTTPVQRRHETGTTQSTTQAPHRHYTGITHAPHRHNTGTTQVQQRDHSPQLLWISINWVLKTELGAVLRTVLRAVLSAVLGAVCSNTNSLPSNRVHNYSMQKAFHGARYMSNS